MIYSDLVDKYSILFPEYETILEQYYDYIDINGIIHLYLKYDSNREKEIQKIVSYQPVKIKKSFWEAYSGSIFWIVDDDGIDTALVDYQVLVITRKDLRKNKIEKILKDI